MKKISSLFLALIIALSLTTVAFAAPQTINVGETKSVTLNQDKSITYQFTAKETAIYAIDLTAKNDCYVYCEVYNVENTNETVNESAVYIDFDDTADWSFSFPANKDSAFLIVLTEMSGNDPTDPDSYVYDLPAKVTLTLKKDSVPYVRLNGTYSVKDTFVQYAFLPTESGNYNFRSNAKFDNCTDPMIIIYDDMNNMKFNDDIGYDDNWNFDLSFYCEAGRIYLLAIGTDYYAEDEYDEPDVNYSFTVKKADNIKPEAIYAYENKISMARRDFYYTGIEIAPAGSDVNIDLDDITVTSSNPRVANVESIELFDNVLELEIDSYKLGKTKITVELANGESTEIVVKVKPAFILWIESFFGMLFG